MGKEKKIPTSWWELSIKVRLVRVRVRVRVKSKNIDNLKLLMCTLENEVSKK